MDLNMDDEIVHKMSIKIIAAVSLCISTLFLCTHLIVFIITAYERTIMGKNFAMFCVMTLLGYVSYIGSIFLQDEDKNKENQVNVRRACTTISIVGHFVSVAQSAWLLSTSVETWRCIKTTKNQQEHEAKYSWRFSAYSLFSWLLPAIISLVTLRIEFGEADWPDTWKPSISQRSCRFGQPSAFLLLHILPVNVNLAINFAFIAATSYKMTKMEHDSKYYHNDMIREFKYYLRLNLLVGATCLVGLFGEYNRDENVILLHVLMNAFLGLYIFLIMTFHDKISTFMYYVDTEYGMKILSDDECEIDDSVDESSEVLTNITKM